MARHTFGGNGTVRGNTGVALPGQVGTAWTAETGGQQLTDLQRPDGTAITTIVTGANGKVPRYVGPNGVVELWLDFGSDRFLDEATDVDNALDATVTALQALLGAGVQGSASTLAERLSAIEASIGTAGTATYS